MADLTLTPDEEAQLNAAQAAIADLKSKIQRFKRAGFDASALETNLARVETAARGLLREFGSQAAKLGK